MKEDMERNGIAKKHGIDVIFTRGQSLKQKLATPKGQNLDKQGVVYSVKCKNKRCKMEYIGQTGRQLKCRIKEHEADSKLDFRKKSGKKKKEKLSGLLYHLKKKKTSNRLEFNKDFGKRKQLLETPFEGSVFYN